jgi:hypothetical protein
MSKHKRLPLRQSLMNHIRFTTERAENDWTRHPGDGIPHPVSVILGTLDAYHMQHLTADDMAECLVIAKGDSDAMQQVIRLRGLMTEMGTVQP